MRILWLTNIEPEPVSKYRSVNAEITGGWISGLYSALLNYENEYIFCFPTRGKSHAESINCKEKYYCFHMEKKEYLYYSQNKEKEFAAILEMEEPDVIHVFGTEYPYSLEMLNAARQKGLIERTVVSIQGLVNVYAQRFKASIPERVFRKKTLKEYIRKTNLHNQKQMFEKRGQYEVELIKKAQHVIGRTHWDYACTRLINLNCKYHKCNEIMRDEFYDAEWSYESCEKRSIFVSQGNYPIKGLHILLKALEIVRDRVPDLKVYIAGDNIVELNRDIRTRSSYGIYILKEIKKRKLDGIVNFVGRLDSNGMKKELIRSNVFISPSSIENSSNSISEAMLVGVPIIASDVGGTKSLIDHNFNGFLYPFDEYQMLAYYIIKVFNFGNDIRKMSINGKDKARQLFSPKTNGDIMQSIYKGLIGQ